METKVEFIFHEGIPEEDGYYLVELNENLGPGSRPDMKFDVDYCRAKSRSDGGGREWINWYPHNIKRWAKI
jgi:hypothetical protein